MYSSIVFSVCNAMGKCLYKWNQYNKYTVVSNIQSKYAYYRFKHNIACVQLSPIKNWLL
jgi:hypothetical protein